MLIDILVDTPQREKYEAYSLKPTHYGLHFIGIILH